MTNKLLQGVAILAVTVGLSACAGKWDVNGVSGMDTAGSAFSKALHSEYVTLAKGEIDEFDWRDGAYFLDRAKMSAAGNPPAPQAVDARRLPAGSVDALTAARAALVGVLPTGMKSKPGAAARAQAGFDCWMQEQEENIQPEDIAKCKKMYDDAMAELNVKPAPKPMAKKPMRIPGPFLVFFDWNSDTLDDKANAIIAEAVAAGKKVGSKSSELVGHTDKSGDAKYNIGLSERRAGAVYDAMKSGGYGGYMNSRAKGENNPLVETPDGVREPMNRRVEITLTK